MKSIIEVEREEDKNGQIQRCKIAFVCIFTRFVRWKLISGIYYESVDAFKIETACLILCVNSVLAVIRDN